MKKLFKDLNMFMACFGIVFIPIIATLFFNNIISLNLSIALSFISLISLFLTPISLDNKYGEFFERAHTSSKIAFIVGISFFVVLKNNMITCLLVQGLICVIYISGYIVGKNTVDIKDKKMLKDTKNS